MPDLPEISEDFNADASGYLAALQAMIDRTQELVDLVTELHGAIDDLPNVKNIEINVTGNAIETLQVIKEDINSLDDRTVEVNIVYKNIGGPEEIKQATQVVNQVVIPAQDNIKQQTQIVNDVTKNVGDTGLNPAQTTQAADAMHDYANEVALAAERSQQLTNDTRQTTDSFESLEEMTARAAQNVEEVKVATDGAAEASHAASTAMFDYANEVSLANERVKEAANESAVSAEAQNRLAAEIDKSSLSYTRQQDIIMALQNANQVLKNTDLTLSDAFDMLYGKSEQASTGLEYFSEILSRGGGDAGAFVKNVDSGNPILLSFAQAAHDAGSSVGAMLIPISAASFGITGMATAIHLIVMGSFEFLAVFIPAMVAAGAAAAVMAEGVGQVKEKLTGLYTSAEALGPMFNTTAGDMLGLGHSLQTAQTEADPGVYELLGAAINGVRATLGPTTNGLSSFGQMGMTVLGIVDKFAAEMDIELGGSMGQLRGLISGGVQALVEFGQILGNIGHAVLNLASDMPGLAEIILKLVDGFSQLIKWVSDLPPGLIAVVMGIEEAYRWSGLAAGAFGLLGKAMALIGTLGIPAIVKIGSNMASMVSNVISGIAGLIANFGALTEKVVMGAATMAEAMGASGLAEKFLGAATAIDGGAEEIVSGLGKAAGFMTGPWGAAIALAVAGLAVLTIFMLRQKSATEEWIGAAQQAVSAASNLEVLDVIGQKMAGAANLIAVNAGQANTALRETGGDAELAGKGLGTAGMAYQAATGAAKELTTEQQNLFNQSQNVIQGASLISKEYGVSFTAALGLADAANVKLINGYAGSSKAAQVAQQQVANLVTAYAKMDQTGTTLANSMQAIDVQAGLQASKVQQVNQAWDQFLSLSTGLTGGLSQLNIDLQQMGTSATTAGTKITAAGTATTMSVSQIAASLKGFSGSSAQVWQSYNQSVQQAETFTDALRTAAAAGAVTQTQFKEGIAGVVQELLPYAADSSAARNELGILASEAGYAGNDSFASLKAWIDKTGGSTVNLGGLVDQLVSKLGNVTNVAKTFAGTLQSDVLGAIAQAAVGTSGITKLTQNYTSALQENGAQAPQTKAAQDALTAALEHEGFTSTETTQLTQELSNAYGANSDAAKTNTNATDTNNGAVQNMANTLAGPAKNAVDEVKAHTDLFTGSVNQNTTAIGGQGDKAGSTANGPLTALDNITKDIHTWTQQLESVMSRWPPSESTKVNVTGSGSTKISSSVPGVSGGTISLSGAGVGLAGGGVIPGFAPGQDSIPAMLSPGEGVLVPQAVRAMGGAPGIKAINEQYQHFAAGGIVLPNVTGWAENTLGQSETAITNAYKAAITQAINNMKQQAQQLALASGPAGGATGSEMANGAELYQYLLANVFDGHKIAAAGAIASIWGESTWNPFSINCVPLTYKVVTERGVLSHWEVRKGDRTPVYNPKTGRVEWAVVLAVPYHMDAQICRLGNLNWSVVCTWDHKWLTEDGLMMAKDMGPGTKVLLGDGWSEVIEFAWDLGVEDTFCLTTTTGTWTAYRDEETAADEGNPAGPFWTGNSDGRGLIGWTPQGTISNAAFEGGMKTQEPAIIAFINSSGDEGVIREMMNATSVSQAANEWGVGVERYGIDDVHAEGIALATSIMNAGGSSAPATKAADAIAHAARSTQDSGGWIYPGLNMIQNNTGRIERTLGPNESSGDLHVHVMLNDQEMAKAIFPAIQQQGFKYASRNNGNNSNKGQWSPR